MSENPFLKQGKTWKPPDNITNPYRPAKIIKQIVETVPLEVPLPTKPFEPVESGNPYISPAEYQTRTGVRMIVEDTPNNFQTINGTKKITISIKTNEINKKFTVKPDGIYLKPKNDLTKEESRLCNFNFEILELVFIND